MTFLLVFLRHDVQLAALGSTRSGGIVGASRHNFVRVDPVFRLARKGAFDGG